MQKIAPFLWFDKEAEEAANFYTGLFQDSKITSVTRYPEGSPGPAGTAMTVGFQLFGQTFTALNGGPIFKFNESVSFVVNCETQEELNKYWDAFINGGGTESQCGWLKDKWGLSWQIVPTALPRLLADKDKKKAQAVMQAMLKMKKIDVPALQQAYDNA
jgi:predicted 3-demethylubiquinone-9 3-methyltransferase (glyoxalase superfamily)